MEDDKQGGIAHIEKFDLQELSRKELIEKVERVTASNETLRRQIRNLQSKASKSDHRKRDQRSFDFSNCSQKKVALRLAYVGWDYQGFASQDNTSNTIEHELFAALNKTCLIGDREACDYSRCGRTDKGVSAFGQVVALKLRSNDGKPEGNNLDYIKMLNRVLPPAIKILAWAAVSDDFDARFSCESRNYKYFFPMASLDLEVMQIAAKKLIGQHDFRNFCKVDVGNNVNHFIRNIQNIQISPFSSQCTSSGGGDMCEITIEGMAFLWHQVRCMVSILFLIGLHLEKPEVIDRLLDVKAYPKKPQYSIVSEIPLILYDCKFDSVNWKFESEQMKFSADHFNNLWTSLAVRKAMIGKILNECRELQCNSTANDEINLLHLMPGHRKNNYKSLLSRPVCDGIDRHLEKQAVKRKRKQEREERKKMPLLENA